jgi:putative ABC transport system ATP-binding protein
MAARDSKSSHLSRSDHQGLAVSLTAVSKTYRSGTGESVNAVDAVTLAIPSGQSVAITGRSGSGKSTLLHLIGAMDVPDAGQITIDGTDIARLRDSERAALRRRIGFVFQRFHLLPALTALDNVLAPVIPYRTDFDKVIRARDLLGAVGLADRVKHLPSQLSGGEQQRVAIARALINHPGIVLADEPTGNLDTHTGADIVALLLQLRDEHGLTLLVATHDTSIAERCDRVVSLSDGRLLNDGERVDVNERTR